MNLFTLALLTVAPPAIQDQVPPPILEIEGIYRMVGEDAGPGVVTIQKAKDKYSIIWSYASGEHLIGIAIREEGHLWAAWGNARLVGLSRYKIEWDKDKVVLVGDKGTTERLERLGDLKER